MLMDLYGLAEGKGRAGNPAPVLINIHVLSIRFFINASCNQMNKVTCMSHLGWLPSSRSNSPMATGPPQVSLIMSDLDTFQRAIAEMQIRFLNPGGADKNV